MARAHGRNRASVMAARAARRAAARGDWPSSAKGKSGSVGLLSGVRARYRNFESNVNNIIIVKRLVAGQETGGENNLTGAAAAAINMAPNVWHVGASAFRWRYMKSCISRGRAGIIHGGNECHSLQIYSHGGTSAVIRRAVSAAEGIPGLLATTAAARQAAAHSFSKYGNSYLRAGANKRHLRIMPCALSKTGEWRRLGVAYVTAMSYMSAACLLKMMKYNGDMK